MKRAEDPYKGLLKLMGNIGKSSGLQATPVIGEIITPPPALTVSYNGMVLDSKYLWIDEYWLQGHTRNARGHIISATQNLPAAAATLLLQATTMILIMIIRTVLFIPIHGRTAIKF